MMSVTKRVSFLSMKAKFLLKATKIGMMFSLIFFSAFFSLQFAYSAPLELSLSTSKPIYTAGERTIINGNLTLNQNPVPDGLVTIQVNDPRGNLRIIRTRPTGTNITRRWSVEILNIVPISAVGQTEFNFKRGDDIGFNVTIRNNDLTPHDVDVEVCIYYPNEVPIRTASIYNSTIGANQTIMVTSYPFALISTAAPLGTAVAYANALHLPLPQYGGFAYAPEKSVAFNITTSTASSSLLASTDGSFNLSLSTPRVDARLGNYTAYATSFYTVGVQPYFVTTSITYEVKIIGDLNGDGKCNIRDISIVSRAFGSIPGTPNWNPIADVYPDLKINIRDISIVARDYGKTGVYP